MHLDIRVHPVSGIAMLVFAAVFLLVGVSFFTVGTWTLGVICILATVLYLVLAAMDFAVVHADSTGISRKVLFLPAERYTWDQIKEVGIFGSRVFKEKDSKHVGTLNMYFSTTPMTEDDRFNMILKWPIKQIHFVYTPRALELVQYFWEKEIIVYNAGDFHMS